MTRDEHQSRLCVIHRNLVQRCTNSKNPAYSRYGGKGISVDASWLDYEVFKLWAYKAGYSEFLTIDRINNDKGYSPDNCRWVSYQIQARNKGKRTNTKATSSFIGVSWRPRNKKWVSTLFVNGKNVYLGLFTNEVDAAQSRDDYIIQNNLEGFTLNFQ
jgi:hypothetical protein